MENISSGLTSLRTHLDSARNNGAPGVDSHPAIALPGVIVALVVDHRILVRLPAEDVPVVSVGQKVISIVSQVARPILALQHKPLHVRIHENDDDLCRL